jgi:large subunit GTPase 1
VLARKIPKSIFEKLYHIKIDIEKPTASQIMTAFALQRGYYTGGSGLPDHAKVSRIILKDLVNGKLLLCKLSPEYNEEKDGKIYLCNEFIEKQLEEQQNIRKEEEENAKEKEEFDPQEKEVKKEIDDDFFEKMQEDPELNEHDLALLLQGKAVKGVKLTKPMRRDLKHALKRGEVKKKKMKILH